MMNLHKLLAPAAILAFSLFILDHFAPDLVPRPPRMVTLAIVAAASALAAYALAVKGWTHLLERAPRPWLPLPFWRVARWIRQRPSVSIIQPFPKIEAGPSTVDHCAFSITVGRNLVRAGAGMVTLRFDAASLVMTQMKHGRHRRFVFSPTEVGGFLALPTRGGAFDAVKVDFVAAGAPWAPQDAPDFTADYTLELRGVCAAVDGPVRLAGELAPATWTWFREAAAAPLDFGPLAASL